MAETVYATDSKVGFFYKPACSRTEARIPVFSIEENTFSIRRRVKENI